MKGRLITKADLPLSLSQWHEVRKFCFGKMAQGSIWLLHDSIYNLPPVLTKDWTDEKGIEDLHVRASRHTHVTPEEWRSALLGCCKEVIEKSRDIIGGSMEEIRAAMLWRAALALSFSLEENSIAQSHVVAKRDNGKPHMALERELEFDEEDQEKIRALAKFKFPLFMPDVMLASGISMKGGMDAVRKLGVSDREVAFISVCATYEGMYNLLSLYPSATIIAYGVGGRLNEKAYIVNSGLGDAGDKFFYGNSLENFEPIRHVFPGHWWDDLGREIHRENTRVLGSIEAA